MAIDELMNEWWIWTSIGVDSRRIKNKYVANLVHKWWTDAQLLHSGLVLNEMRFQRFF